MGKYSFKGRPLDVCVKRIGTTRMYYVLALIIIWQSYDL